MSVRNLKRRIMRPFPSDCDATARDVTHFSGCFSKLIDSHSQLHANIVRP